MNLANRPVATLVTRFAFMTRIATFFMGRAMLYLSRQQRGRKWEMASRALGSCAKTA